MDVETDAMPDDTCLKEDRQHSNQASDSSTMLQQADMIDLPEPEEEQLATSTHQDQGDQPPKPPPAKKQKVTSFSKVIGLAPSPRNNPRQSDKMDSERLRVRLQVSQARVNALKKTIDDLQVEIGSVQDENREFRQWSHGAEMEYGRMLTRCDDLEQDLMTKEDNHRKEQTELQARVNDLTHTNDRLRQMIVPVSEKQVPDSDVVSKFTSLCNSILRLVRQTWKPAIRADFDPRQLSERQRDFFESRLPLSYNRLRSVVFHMIYYLIFGSRSYFLDETFRHLEESLQTVEADLSYKLPEEGRRRVIEWRNATFKATESLRDNGSRLSSTAHDQIWGFLSPLEAKDAAAETNGRKKLKCICDNAVELSLMIRQLKDDFWVYNLDNAVNKHISRCQKGAEEVESVAAVEGHAVGTVAYAITGALVKCPKEDPKKALVLEKGEVAVFE